MLQTLKLSNKNQKKKFDRIDSWSFLVLVIVYNWVLTLCHYTDQWSEFPVYCNVELFGVIALL